MGMFVLLPSVMVVTHWTHHEKVGNWAKQDQAEIKNSIRGDIEQEDCRQPDKREQTAKQHNPDVAFVHLNLLSSIISFVYSPRLEPDGG